MEDCLFCKIIDGTIPTKKLYEDDFCVAFNDTKPQAPTHFLVVPKKHIASAVEITDDDATLIGHIFAVISLLTFPVYKRLSVQIQKFMREVSEVPAKA